MTGIVAAATDGLLQHTGDAASTEQIAGYGSQLSEAGYVVIPDLVWGDANEAFVASCLVKSLSR